jgi:hypothetical protein
MSKDEVTQNIKFWSAKKKKKKNYTILMKTTTLWFWPTMNLSSLRILGFLYSGVAEDSSFL